ncbi:sigma-70 family RNA polymerase sigma factor [candidate division KSB1 bacterium]|nr:sigma-70 family RNA polymerase sigma factor [candidate division KSB1 bacterium]
MIGQGDLAAFDEIYQRYSQRLLAFFVKALNGDRVKAEDFLQDLFIKIIDRPQRFDPEKNFATWIFTIAHNACKNEYRRLKIRKNIEPRPEAEIAVSAMHEDYLEIEKAIDQERLTHYILKELAQFDATRRTIFLLRFQQNFSIKAISEIIGCSEGTVKSRLFYMIRKLAGKLKVLNPSL